MPFLDVTQYKAAFKTLFGKAHTANAKDLPNESISANLIMHASWIFADTIDSDPAQAVIDGVAEFVTFDMELDPTSNGKAYRAKYPVGHPLYGQYATDIIPPNFSSGYVAVLKNNTVVVPPLAAQNWFLNYQNGIVVSETNLTLVNGTLEAYRYIGSYISGTGANIWEISGSLIQPIAAHNTKSVKSFKDVITNSATVYPFISSASLNEVEDETRSRKLLKATVNDPIDTAIDIAAGIYSLSDGSDVGLVNNNLVVTYAGGTIDFSTGVVTGGGSSFTPYDFTTASYWAKYGVVLLPDNTLLVIMPTGEAATKSAAPNPPVTGGLPVIVVAVQDDGSAGSGTIENISNSNLLRFGAAGSGSGGTGGVQAIEYYLANHSSLFGYFNYDLLETDSKIKTLQTPEIKDNFTVVSSTTDDLNVIYEAQTFTTTSSYTPISARLKLGKAAGTISGCLKVRITGTSTGQPNMSNVICESGWINVDSLNLLEYPTNPLAWKEFIFETNGLLADATLYAIVIEMSYPSGFANVDIEIDTAGTYAGGTVWYDSGGGWVQQAASDLSFSVYASGSTIPVYESVDTRIKFLGTGEQVITENLVASRCYDTAEQIGTARVIAESDDDALTAEISTDELASWTDLPLSRVRNSNYLSSEAITLYPSYSVVNEDVEYNDTTKYDDDLILDSSTKIKIGQGISVSTETQVSAFSAYLKKNGAPTGLLCIEIYDDNSGVPGNLIQKSAWVDISTLGGSYSFVKFEMNQPCNLLVGNQYYAVLASVNYTYSVGVDEVWWGDDASSPSYTGGNAYTFNGVTWTSDVTRDLLFESERMNTSLYVRFTSGTAGTTYLNSYSVDYLIDNEYTGYAIEDMQGVNVSGVSAGRIRGDGTNNNVNALPLSYDSTDKKFECVIAPTTDGHHYLVGFLFSLSNRFVGFNAVSTSDVVIRIKAKADNGSGDAVNYAQIMTIRDSVGVQHSLSAYNIKTNLSTLSNLDITKTIIDATNGTWVADTQVYVEVKCFGNVGDNIYVDEDSAVIKILESLC